MDQRKNDDKITRMKELHRQLLAASRAYYQESREIMSNFEYDRLYDELLKLEKETGMVLAGSPTQKVGYEVLSELPKEAHEAPMLSLDKTKEIEVLKNFVGNQKTVLQYRRYPGTAHSPDTPYRYPSGFLLLSAYAQSPPSVPPVQQLISFSFSFFPACKNCLLLVCMHPLHTENRFSLLYHTRLKKESLFSVFFIFLQGISAVFRKRKSYGIDGCS